MVIIPNKIYLQYEYSIELISYHKKSYVLSKIIVTINLIIFYKKMTAQRDKNMTFLYRYIYKLLTF